VPAGAVPLSSVALNVARPLFAEKPHKYRSNITYKIRTFSGPSAGMHRTRLSSKKAVLRIGGYSLCGGSLRSFLTADKIYREYAEARILVSLFARQAELQVSC